MNIIQRFARMLLILALATSAVAQTSSHRRPARHGERSEWGGGPECNRHFATVASKASPTGAFVPGALLYRFHPLDGSLTGSLDGNIGRNPAYAP
jgi:hypothetical protein